MRKRWYHKVIIHHIDHGVIAYVGGLYYFKWKANREAKWKDSIPAMGVIAIKTEVHRAWKNGPQPGERLR